MNDQEKAALEARIDELCAENERLRQESRDVGMAAYELGESIDKLSDENAKLRECLQDFADEISGDDGFGVDRGWMLDRIRELGVGDVLRTE